MLDALAERDPLGQSGNLEASRLRKEKAAALECPNYHLTAETPALVHASSAAAAAVVVVVAVAVAAAACRGKGNSKEDEAAVPMFEQGMDTEEGEAPSGGVHLPLRCY
jgi:hypothetical protein